MTANIQNPPPAPAPLVAFHGKPEIKREYLRRVHAHRAADEIIKGQYWEKGKGCAVGCTIHSSDHLAFEHELGIPVVLAHLEDRIFEGLFASNESVLAKQWPGNFLHVIKVGADLSLVWPKFALWLLAHKKEGVIRFAKNEAQRSAIFGVSALFQRWLDGDKPPTNEWKSARHATYATYATYAATYATDATYAYAAYATAAAASTDATYAAAAAATTYAAAAAATTYAATRRKFYLKAAEKLLSLLKSAQPKPA